MERIETFEEIVEDSNVIKLENYKLTKDEVYEILEEIKSNDLFEMGIR